MDLRDAMERGRPGPCPDDLRQHRLGRTGRLKDRRRHGNVFGAVSAFECRDIVRRRIHHDQLRCCHEFPPLSQVAVRYCGGGRQRAICTALRGVSRSLRFKAPDNSIAGEEPPMTNKYLALAVGACAVIFAASGANAQTTLKFGHYNAESHPMHKAAVQFKENVEKRTNGAIKIQIYPNNTLGSPPEILEQTRNGVVDIAVPTSGQLDKYDKAFAALMLPFVFDDIDHARRAMGGAMLQWLTRLAEKSGLA